MGDLFCSRSLQVHHASRKMIIFCKDCNNGKIIIRYLKHVKPELPFWIHPPKFQERVSEAELITRGETIHLVEPEAGEQVWHGRVGADDEGALGHICDPRTLGSIGNTKRRDERKEIMILFFIDSQLGRGVLLSESSNFTSPSDW